MKRSISDIQTLLGVQRLPKSGETRRVFVTGGTGYMGRQLIPTLIERGHTVRALVRKGSENKAPNGCELVVGDALDGNSYREVARQADTFVHLVGVAHPSPAKASKFRAIDLVSAQQAINVASDVGTRHFVYLSVAHPAPVMKAYVAVRSECEAMIRERRLSATILRPWYVLGPGHRWPYALLPMYALLELFPSTRDGARRLGLVTLAEMICALVLAVETGPKSAGIVPEIRVMNVPEIRSAHIRMANTSAAGQA